MAGAIGIGSAIIGGVSSAANLFGGSSGTPSGAASAYVPKNPGPADTAFQNAIQTQQQYAQPLPGQVVPRLQDAVSNIYSNPYAPGYLSGATNAGTYGTNVGAPAAYSGAAALQNLGGAAAGAAPQILNTAFDPQNALYNKLWQQNLDQNNAINSMNGVAGTPFGAGLTAQNNQNFNINWQNNLLQRMVQGAQGFGTLQNAAGQGFTGAAGLGQTGQGFQTTNGAGLPYGTFNTFMNNDIAALNALSGGTASALAPNTGTANLAASYLGDVNAATNTSLTSQNQAFNQSQTLGNNLGSSLTQLSQLFQPQPIQPVPYAPSWTPDTTTIPDVANF